MKTTTNACFRSPKDKPAVTLFVFYQKKSNQRWDPADAETGTGARGELVHKPQAKAEPFCSCDDVSPFLTYVPLVEFMYPIFIACQVELS